MAAIEFPPVHPTTVQPRLIKFGTAQRGSLGGPGRRFVRGGRHALGLSFAPMAKEQAARVIGALLRAQAEGEPLRVLWPQPFDPLYPISAGQVNGAGQTGRLLVCESIAGGGAKANLLGASLALENPAWWILYEATISEVSGYAPDGTFTARKLAETATTDVHYLLQGVAPSPGVGTYTAQGLLLADERNDVVFGLDDGFTSGRIRVNLVTGAVSVWSGSPVNLRSKRVYDPNGTAWWHVSFTWTSSNAPLYLISYPLAGGLSTYAGTLGAGFWLWGLQVNAGAEPSPPVITPASGNAFSVIEAGRAFSYVKDGISYLQIVTEDVSVPADGGVTLPLDTPLRASPADNTVLNFQYPIIEGDAEGDPESWTLDRVMAAGLEFTIVERR